MRNVFLEKWPSVVKVVLVRRRSREVSHVYLSEVTHLIS
jgi:hypothetical protein